MPFDTVKDLAGVCMTAVSGIVMVASPKAPFNNLRELIAHAKANPGKLSYASPGAGSSMHLGGEFLKQQAGIDMVHIPYKGSAGAYPDVSDGRVELLIDPLFASMPHIKSGRLKPIAVLSDKRDPSAPDIPAFGEVLPGFNVQSINGIVVPSATPRELVRKISDDYGKALRSEDLRKRLLAIGLEPVASTPEQFDQFVQTELKRWEAVVRKANISID